MHTLSNMRAVHRCPGRGRRQADCPALRRLRPRRPGSRREARHPCGPRTGLQPTLCGRACADPDDGPRQVRRGKGRRSHTWPAALSLALAVGLRCSKYSMGGVLTVATAAVQGVPMLQPRCEAPGVQMQSQGCNPCTPCLPFPGCQCRNLKLAQIKVQAGSYTLNGGLGRSRKVAEG